MLIDFLKGFSVAIAIAVGIAVIGIIFLKASGSDAATAELLVLFPLLALFVLIAGAGEILASFLIRGEVPLRKKTMQFVGALSAVVAAYFATPLALVFLEKNDPAPKCTTVFEKKIGPVTFSRDECED